MNDRDLRPIKIVAACVDNGIEDFDVYLIVDGLIRRWDEGVLDGDGELSESLLYPLGLNGRYEDYVREFFGSRLRDSIDSQTEQPVTAHITRINRLLLDPEYRRQVLQTYRERITPTLQKYKGLSELQLSMLAYEKMNDLRKKELEDLKKSFEV